MTVYLCTCGTSAFKPNKFELARLNANWVEANGGVEKAAQAIYESFAQVPFDDPAGWSRDLSAELHSLARMRVNEKDTVILYASETPDGQACALAVKRYLEAALPGIVCIVDVVEGLQVTDAVRFRTKGVLEFTRKVLRQIDGNGPENVVLNPTGGFKSLVPYTVLIGMIRRVKARYIFEQSSALIELPSMPVEFAHARLAPFLDVLERIDRDTCISQKEWEREIPHESREELEALFEFEDGCVTLSPVGILVLGELGQARALVPYLSRCALEDLLKMDRLAGRNPQEFLERVARNPKHLEEKTHARLPGGFVWLKPGNTTDRYLVSVDRFRLLVWRIVDHAEYERFGSWQEKQWEALRADARFQPFVRMDLYWP